MSTPKRFGRLEWIGLISIVLIATGAPCRAQQPEFLKRATKIEIPQGFYGVPQWPSPSQFVDCVWPGDKRVKVGIYRYDLTARTLTRLDALTNLVRNAGARDTHFAQEDTSTSESRIVAAARSGLSPDGEWLLWEELWAELSTWHDQTVREPVCVRRSL